MVAREPGYTVLHHSSVRKDAVELVRTVWVQEMNAKITGQLERKDEKIQN